MGVRQKLYNTIMAEISSLEKFELIDLQKGQLDNPQKTFGTIYTAALVEVDDIVWEDKSNDVKEGKAIVNVYIYTKDGFLDQFVGTPDANFGLPEIDLQENVADKLENLKGEGFKPLYLSNEGALPSPHYGIMAYKLEFTTWVYKQLKQRYVS